MQIKINVEASNRIDVNKLEPFQGRLKTLSDENYNRLKNEIIADGFNFAPHVWKTADKFFILDGHQRIHVMKVLKKEGYEFGEIPVCFVTATSYNNAKRKVLQAVSQYGKVDKDGFTEFTDGVDFTFDNFDLPDTDFDLNEEVGSNSTPNDKYDIDDDEKNSMVELYGVPPFSVFDTRQGYWQEGRKKWIEMGIKSELGRDVETINTSFGGRSFDSATSIFDPYLTEILIRWFSADGNKIIDPFAGGSVRGIVTAKLGRNYLGIDLSSKQIEANIDQAKEILTQDEKNSCKWINDDSCNLTNHILDGEKFNMIISCPPYADLEVYSNDVKDLSNMPYNIFLEKYRDIINKSVAALENDSFIAWVVGEVRHKQNGYYNFVGDTITAFIDSGVNYYNEIILLNSAGTLPLRAGKAFNSSRKVGKMHQNVLIFVKGDAKKATKKVTHG